MSSSPSPQRREAFRVGLTSRARARRADGETTDHELGDLSVTGARLIGVRGVSLGDPLTIAIALGAQEIVVEARVVRVDPHGCGVRFEPLPPAVENRISRFLTGEQRRRARPRS